MFDNFINSFCKVQFLCYQGEPNWMGLIVLFPLVIILGLLIVLIIGGVFGAIFEWLSDTGDNINNFFREKPERKKAKIARKQARKASKQARKASKQAELEQLNGLQKVFRIIYLPFKWIGNFLSTLYELILGLIFIGAILGVIVSIFVAIFI